MPTQAQVLADLAPCYPLLWHAVMGPWEDFLHYRETDRNHADLTPDQAAQWLTILITNRARQLLVGQAGIKPITQHGKLVLYLEEKFTLTVKKLTKRSRRIS